VGRGVVRWRGPRRTAGAELPASERQGRLFPLIECYQGVAARKTFASIPFSSKSRPLGAVPFARAAWNQQATPGMPGPSLSRMYSA